MNPPTENPPRKKSKTLSHYLSLKLIKIIELCTKQCFFKYNNTYYQQKLGFPMGSPLSGVLACLTLNFSNSNLSNTSYLVISNTLNTSTIF